MHAARGILTARGGMTSHAAVVARGMGRPCVSGAGGISIDYKAKMMRIGNIEVREDQAITIDGSTGEVMLGSVPTVQPELVGDFGTLMAWADKVRRLRVRTNAETPNDCRISREFGAEGIGLCRTEHMFFDAERITNVRQMILADSEKGRRTALAKLLPAQRGDSRRSSGSWRGCPSPSGCSIRRCTNSCRTARRNSPSSLMRRGRRWKC
jgi:pyruvate,orthophosphate dikinase